MKLELFLSSLALTLAIVGTALIYLRGITRRVLEELCESGTGAEFWLRSADVLALAGSLRRRRVTERSGDATAAHARAGAGRRVRHGGDRLQQRLAQRRTAALTGGRMKAPRVAGPSLSWLPPVLRGRDYWRTVGRFALFGPLVGGLPYAWLVFTLPFIYLVGLLPALVAGLLYAAWLHAAGLRAPSAGWRAALGGLCGAAGCAAVAWAFEPRGPGLGPMFTLLAMHGVPAGVALALN
jgi:hypothetical protein